MKISRVLLNNRKKAFVLQVSKANYEWPFSHLRLKPSASDPVIHAEVDKVIASQGFTYRLKSGKEDTVLLEQVLAHHQDPDVIRNHILYDLTVKAQKILSSSGLSKRALARKLSIPPAQLYRLIDQTFYGKTIDQMIGLFTALGHKVEVSTKAA